jgi:hypothetical protein
MPMSDNVKEQVAEKANRIFKEIIANESLAPYIDTRLSIPDVFVGTGEIKLIVLGQDPTVKDREKRKEIKVTLNLNKRGSVRNYLTRVCIELGLDLKQNVYATNLLKNFFTRPPTQIKEFDIFEHFVPYWLPLVREELARFPNIPIITLGQPLLRALVVDESKGLVRKYWGYIKDWPDKPLLPFSFVPPEDNKLGRRFFPFPHQPSLRKPFYKATLPVYIDYLRSQAFT